MREGPLLVHTGTRATLGPNCKSLSYSGWADRQRLQDAVEEEGEESWRPTSNKGEGGTPNPDLRRVLGCMQNNGHQQTQKCRGRMYLGTRHNMHTRQYLQTSRLPPKID